MKKDTLQTSKEQIGLLLTKLQLYCLVRLRLIKDKEDCESLRLQQLAVSLLKEEQSYIISKKTAKEIKKSYAQLLYRYRKELAWIDSLLEYQPNLLGLSDEELISVWNNEELKALYS